MSAEYKNIRLKKIKIRRHINVKTKANLEMEFKMHQKKSKTTQSQLLVRQFGSVWMWNTRLLTSRNSNPAGTFLPLTGVFLGKPRFPVFSNIKNPAPALFLARGLKLFHCHLLFLDLYWQSSYEVQFQSFFGNVLTISIDIFYYNTAVILANVGSPVFSIRSAVLDAPSDVNTFYSVYTALYSINPVVTWCFDWVL